MQREDHIAKSLSDTEQQRIDLKDMIPMSELPLTMFIVLRKDLAKSLSWNTGSVIAQACHATSAVTWIYREHPNVQAYFSDIGSLHKVILETKNEASFEKICEALREKNFLFHKWVEQPEGISTALCTIPYKKYELGDIFRKCQLYKT